MNVCMSILREKLFMIFFMIFYELLHYGNNMHECMYVNLKRIAAYLLISGVTSQNNIIV